MENNAVTLAKPVGGGVVDIEHVPVDIANGYIQAGYTQLDTDGLFPSTGYCIAHPANGEEPAGYDCQPAPTPQVLAVTVQPSPAPTRLPAVGDGFESMFVAIILTLVVTKMLGSFKVKQ